MVTVKTHLDPETYRMLVKMRKAAGVPSVSALFLKKCNLLTDGQEAAEIARLGFIRAKNQSSGFEFCLRELFDEEEWNKFAKGARLRAGRLFFEKVSAAVDGVRALRKTSSNQQVYVVS